MNYKMIVLDLDGTLTNRDKVITPRTKAALMEAQKQGKTVILASGRPTYGVMPLAKELHLQDYNGYILSFNGGMMVDCRTDEVLFASQLPVEANGRIIDLAIDQGVNLLTYEGDQIITPDMSCPYARKEALINHLQLHRINHFRDYVDFPVPKFLLLDDGDYLALVEPKVKAALGKNFSVYRSEPYFLEILPKGIDKAQSLARLLNILGLNQEQMIACGDGYNDLSMIQYAGLGVAMENAVFSVRTVADYVTLSNDADGVALVVEKFMLS
ncbi:MAG: Cof-type HAD-IIB family hydrolase [Hungatella sp.]